MKTKIILILFLSCAVSAALAASNNQKSSNKSLDKTKITAKKSKNLQNSDTEEKAKPEKSYPFGCKITGFTYSHGLLVLTPHKSQIKQGIYFIQNTANHDVTFFDQRNGASPYIIYNDNTVRAGQWAVFATDSPTKFVCSKKEIGATVSSLVDCKNILKICEYANVKFAPNNRGSYWATTNMSLSAAVREVITQGILLKS